MSRAPGPVALVLTALLAVAGCTPPADTDGEALAGGVLAAAPAATADAVPVVVDTDLGGDDLVALALLLRHPRVEVRAVTVATTGLAYHCLSAVDLVADLLVALDEPAVPVACGSNRRGPRGGTFPAAWRSAAMAGEGLPRDPGTLPVDPRPAADVLAAAAHDADGALVVVALGPLTNVARALSRHPAFPTELSGLHVMAGVVDGPGQDQGGVGEWNAAADPEALDAVLAAAAPVTVVPADVVPPGTPDALRAPVIGGIVLHDDVGAWWDVAAAAAFAEPATVTACERGTWRQDAVEAGRLHRGDAAGSVCVVRRLDADALEGVYRRAFRSGGVASAG